MKVTIELSENQVKGIKKYLKEVGEIESPKKDDVQNEIDGIVKSYFQAQSSSLTNYINEFENE